MKPNKSISRKKICNFKNDQKSIFEVGKSFNLPEMQFHEEKFFDIFDLVLPPKAASIYTAGQKILKSPGKKFLNQIKQFREIAFLTVLNFFPVQKLIFGHF